jgi:hypothetical protein
MIGSLLGLGALSLLCQLTVFAQTNVIEVTNPVVVTDVTNAAVATGVTNMPVVTNIVHTNVVVVQTNIVMQTNVIVPAPAPVPPPPPPKEEEKHERFHSGEADLSLYGQYIDRAGGKWGGGAALTFYPIQDIGIGASTFIMDNKGTFFDNVEGELYLRLPLFDLVAPYAVGSFGYEFDHEYSFETVGGGVDFRPFKHIAAFADGQYLISNNHDKASNSPFFRIGLRYFF